MHLVRVAWHLGNRHLPTQIMTKGLRIRRDHVIEEMVTRLGARVIEIEAPFDPEGGAYAGAACPCARQAIARSRRTIMRHVMITTTTAITITPSDHHDHDEHCDHDHHHGHSHAHDHK